MVKRFFFPSAMAKTETLLRMFVEPENTEGFFRF